MRVPDFFGDSMALFQKTLVRASETRSFQIEHSASDDSSEPRHLAIVPDVLSRNGVSFRRSEDGGS
jgi:hypothetical protein